MLKNAFILIVTISFLFSCSPEKIKVDTILHNAVIYSVDSLFTTYQAIAIKDGKVVDINTNKEILQKYGSENTTDLNGKAVFPGFIDAHCHFYGYGKGLNELDLVGTKSFKEVIERTISYAKEMNFYPEVNSNETKKLNQEEVWIIGRGWDQNDWESKQYPTKKILDSLFPARPVMLTRIDGHAALVNEAALQEANLTGKTKIKGGELLMTDNKLTGILIDNAVDLVSEKIPKPSQEQIKKALLKAQKNCLAAGLTTVDDAGLEKNIVDAIDELHKSNELKIKVYAMLTPTKGNMDHYLKSGIYITDKLTVRSFKFYGDGALGSRGACLLKDYADKKDWKGFLLNDLDYYMKMASKMEESGFQMNTHCIGDSAVWAILAVYGTNPKMFGDVDGEVFKEICKKRRWRIEHAQIVDKNHLEYFKGLSVIPSIQPTHATSDMYWAKERLGEERVKTAYAYKDLLTAVGNVALGTDFPVEDISPFKTFFAAVARQDSKGFPKDGFQMENALSREETLKGMTIWAAYSNFEEKQKGSLEKGKSADLIILDTDIMKCKIEDVLKTKVLNTYINGEKVFTLTKE